jgi:hypothetical protein
MSLGDAERAVGATLLWHLRVLAGWQPPDGVSTVRLLAAGFEIANVEDHLTALEGGPGAPPYQLGALGTAWGRLGRASSPAEVRDVLGASPWRDPRGTPIPIWMRVAWADRVVDGVPEAAAWARAATTLLLARHVLLEGRALDEPLRARVGHVMGPDAVIALSRGTISLASLARSLPADARWVLDDLQRPIDLWRAEAAWWRRLDRDGSALLRSPDFGREALVGAVARLAVDTFRVCAALETAARGGSGSALEVFDAVA